jgi:hypothetical protein
MVNMPLERMPKIELYSFGDALTIRLHSLLYDKILQQMTQLGNEEYVRILLDAQEQVFVQKGHFHQQMHLLGSIYTVYRSFVQAFQVSNGAKRVNGDPVKSEFQCHEQFAMKLYHTCNRFMLRMYCESLDIGALL